MSDLENYKVHGPVKTLKSESATWDKERQDWEPAWRNSEVSFRPDGAIAGQEEHFLNGSVAHSLWVYDDAGRKSESKSWMNDGPANRTVYHYDETGRPKRTTYLGSDGTEKEVDTFQYDADGRKIKVHTLPREVSGGCNAEGACTTSVAYSIEGSDSACGAPGAATMTVEYDDKDLPVKVSFHDASQRAISSVVMVRDGAGRLLYEEMRPGEVSPFQNLLDKAPPEQREQMAAAFKTAFSSGISNTTYLYDADGRLLKRETRMGGLGSNSTTFAYNEHGDPVEETTEDRNREGRIDETGAMSYSEDKVTVHHNRFEYRYDANGNWTEKIVLYRLETGESFERSNVERRVITYYGGS